MTEEAAETPEAPEVEEAPEVVETPEAPQKPSLSDIFSRKQAEADADALPPELRPVPEDDDEAPEDEPEDEEPEEGDDDASEEEPEGGEGEEEPEEERDTTKERLEDLQGRHAVLKQTAQRLKRGRDRAIEEKNQAEVHLRQANAAMQSIAESVRSDPRQALAYAARLAGIPVQKVFDTLADKLMSDPREASAFDREPEGQQPKPNGMPQTPEELEAFMQQRVQKAREEERQRVSQASMQADLEELLRVPSDAKYAEMFPNIAVTPVYRIKELAWPILQHAYANGKTADEVAATLDELLGKEYASIDAARSAQRGNAPSGSRAADKPARKTRSRTITNQDASERSKVTETRDKERSRSVAGVFNGSVDPATILKR